MAAEGSWPYRRDLFQHEAAAQLDVPDLDYAMQLSQERLIAAWQPLRVRFVQDLLQQVKAAVDAHPAGDASWIGKIELSQLDTSGLVAGVEAAIDEGRLTALDEARRQNPDIAARVSVDAMPATPRLVVYCESAARLLSQSLLQTASREAFRLTATTASVDVEAAVQAVLGDTSTRYERDILQGMSTGGVNEGRYHVMEAILGTRPTSQLEAAGGAVSVYALEILDGNTCDACAAIDGQEYATIEEARVDYPGVGGGYVECYGRERCRGSIVIVYPEATSFGDTSGMTTTPPDLSPPPAAPAAPARPPTWNQDNHHVTDEAHLALQAANRHLADMAGQYGTEIYDLRAQLDRYTGSGYKNMNRQLRGQPLEVGGPGEATVRGYNADMQKLMDSEAATVSDVHMLVHRGQSINAGEDIVGTTLRDEGWMSTSLSTETANSFLAYKSRAGREKVIMRVHVLPGSRYLPGNHGERELVFPAGSRLHIVQQRGTERRSGYTYRVFDAILDPGAP